MSTPALTVTSDFTKEFNAIVRSFKSDAVLVGIPEETPSRKKEVKEKGEINNATLLALNNFGSHAQNIPPRPVMSIGIFNAQEAIADQFKKAIQDSFSKGIAALNTYYERAGIIASNSIKNAINAQDGFDGPAASTLRARQARGFKGTKALVVTGQMRNAITWVINS